MVFKLYAGAVGSAVHIHYYGVGLQAGLLGDAAGAKAAQADA